MVYTVLHLLHRQKKVFDKRGMKCRNSICGGYMKPWVKVAAPDLPIPTRDRPTILSFLQGTSSLSLPVSRCCKKGVGKPRVVGLFHPCYCEGFCWGGGMARGHRKKRPLFSSSSSSSSSFSLASLPLQELQVVTRNRLRKNFCSCEL